MRDFCRRAIGLKVHRILLPVQLTTFQTALTSRSEEGRRKKEECHYSKLFGLGDLAFNQVDLLTANSDRPFIEKFF
ncbi:MAG: hypothetical protein ACRC62_34120 [Microcoleus sp.]